MLKNNLKPYAFIDGDFSMEINVSEEERTIYLNQNEIANVFEISKALVSKLVKQHNQIQMGQVSNLETLSKKSVHGVSNYCGLEIIKEIGQKYNPERLEKLENWLYDLFPENDIDIIDGGYEIVRYNQDNLDVPVIIDSNDLLPWLTQKQMAEIFGTTVSNINQHISNIFEDNELEKDSVIKNYLNTADDGKTYKTIVYNVDMIYAVGYRTRTSKAIQFRKWQTAIGKKFLNDNYNRFFGNQLSGSYTLSKLDSLETELNNLKKEVNDLKPKNIIFYKQQGYDAYIFLSVFIATANKEIFIIDPYADRFTLSLLNTIKNNLSIIIVFGKNGQITDQELILFESAHPNTTIKLIRNDDEHDRHVFIDRKYGYIVGSSTNSLSYHSTSVVSVDEKYIKEKIAPYIKKDA